MDPEGVVRALRLAHAALVHGGALLDLHPRPPSSRVMAGGRKLGRLDERVFAATVRDAEKAVNDAIGAGRFAREADMLFDVIERHDNAEELAAHTWRGTRLPRALAARIRASSPPLDVRARVYLQRLRAI